MKNNKNNEKNMKIIFQVMNLYYYCRKISIKYSY